MRGGGVQIEVTVWVTREILKRDSIYCVNTPQFTSERERERETDGSKVESGSEKIPLLYVFAMISLTRINLHSSTNYTSSSLYMNDKKLCEAYLRSRQAEESFFQNWILFVPQRKREAKAALWTRIHKVLLAAHHYTACGKKKNSWYAWS